MQIDNGYVIGELIAVSGSGSGGGTNVSS